MTYHQLLESLAALSPLQLNQTVTVYVSDSDEYYPINILEKSVTDVLDEGHLVLKSSPEEYMKNK